VNTRSRYSDAEVEDFKTAILALSEVIRSIALAQGWSYRPIEQWVELWSGAELEEAVPAVRRAVLLLEER
jgi:hypothetical protein